MVRSARVSKLLLLVVLVILCLTLALVGICAAQEGEAPTIEEEYTVVIDEVGNGEVTDTIKYNDEEFYQAVKDVEEENKGFLTRRLESVDNVGEVINADVEFDNSDDSVVVTYDYPGYVYQLSEGWTIGVSEKPKQDDKKFIIEESGVYNGEFTLFTDQVMDITTTYELPDEATNARYDSGAESILYDMPPAQSTLGFWGENRTLLTIIFGALTVLFLLLLVFVLTRKVVPGPAGAARSVTATPPATVPPAAKPAAPPPGPAAGKPAAPPTKPPSTATGVPSEKEGTRCAKCGHVVPAGKKFCTKCGARIEG